MIDKTICVVDGGMFLEFALRLARDFKRVLYCADIRLPYPRVQETVIGDNLPGVERIPDPFAEHDVDVWAFPDCTHPELQAYLRSRGDPVWGSGNGCRLEWNRVMLRRELERIGLPVRPYYVARGLSELRAYLQDREDQFVRISRFRGNMETWRWINADLSSGKLDDLAVEFGPLQNEIEFLVEEGYDAVETGYDGYYVAHHGFPQQSFHGLEVKDKAYLGVLTPYDDLPEALRETNDRIAQLLDAYGYANFFSTEVRIAEDGLPYLEDPTCRHASPAGEPLLEAIDNLPEVVFAGAHGSLVEPVVSARFVAQALIEQKMENDRLLVSDRWRILEVPDKVRRWVKLYNPVRIGGTTYAFPPMAHSFAAVGSVLGLGQTAEEAIDAVKEHAKAVEGQNVCVETALLADAVAEMDERKGDAITLPPGQTLPTPSIVLSDA